MSVAWTITNPSGAGTGSFATLGIQVATVNFRIMATSKARLQVAWDYDSTDTWWTEDTLVTIYRDGLAYFTGRVMETPYNASIATERRTLDLVDGWQDLEDIIYQESWAIGAGTVDLPKAILGLDSTGTSISTGQQIQAAVDYGITQGANLVKGTVDAGPTVWPSEVKNQSCASVILGEMRWNPDWVAWIDHSTSTPTFNARARSALGLETVDIEDDETTAFNHSKLVRNKPRGVRIIYEDAASIGGEVFRNTYEDTAGTVTGRRVMQATIPLEGLNMQFQKSRIQTRTMPTDNTTLKAYFKLKWPELDAFPDSVFSFSNTTFTAADEEPLPDPICSKATRLTVTDATDLPRELVKGSIEDWMRVKVGRVIVKYDLEIIGNPTAEQRKILNNFTGEGKTFSVTATNATTKLYKGITTFTEGESAPVGLAASVYAAASSDKYEGSVSTAFEDVPATVYPGKQIKLVEGVTTIMPEAILHSASCDIFNGTVDLDFGPLPYLSAGDFFELQKMVNGRKTVWMSGDERSSNALGATDNAGSQGDTVTGFDGPDTVAPPGGGPLNTHPWKFSDGGGGNLDIAAGLLSGYYLTFSAFSGNYDAEIEGPDHIVKGPAFKYAGGSVAISTGTKYVYAIATRNGPSTVYGGNQDVELPSDPGFEGNQEIYNYDVIEPSGFTSGEPTDSATIDVSDTSPDAYTPTTGKAAVCLGKVTYSEAGLSIDDQYVTTNEDIFVPIARGLWSYP